MLPAERELGNFEHISFNIGPTLLEWMAKHDPRDAVTASSSRNANLEKYGVGNGMAQAYNHTILPLASLEDNITQVRWGIADFEFRFGHKPQGMWLPETAADDETLGGPGGLRDHIHHPGALAGRTDLPGPLPSLPGTAARRAGDHGFLLQPGSEHARQF